MPSPERPSRKPRREQEPPLPEYSQASRYADEQPAGEAYLQAQDAIFGTDYELSAYRFQLEKIWHVAVLGDTPPEDFDELVRSILSTGAPASLPPQILTFLNERRIQARQLGSWVEGHYRPGRRIDL